MGKGGREGEEQWRREPADTLAQGSGLEAVTPAFPGHNGKESQLDTAPTWPVAAAQSPVHFGGHCHARQQAPIPGPWGLPSSEPMATQLAQACV